MYAEFADQKAPRKHRYLSKKSDYLRQVKLVNSGENAVTRFVILSFVCGHWTDGGNSNNITS